jgi:RES domain-containing protein
MQAYRLCRPVYFDLDGEGARLHGGRWNPRGLAMVYTSESRALAVLETLVHGGAEFLPRDLALLTIDIPDTCAVEDISVRELPNHWNSYPAPSALAAVGSAWLARGAALALRVPSVIVPEEHNLLLNPLHAEMLRVRIVRRDAFRLDDRLVGTE